VQEAVRAGVIGYGYWGPNLARNIAACEEMELVSIADLRADRRDAAARAHPRAAVLADPSLTIGDASLDLLVLATPPGTHYELAAGALRGGKHVLVEKPLVTNGRQAEELVALADRVDRHLLVDHTFLFTGAVRRIREEVGTLGELLYYDATRTNLGTFQADTDVLWDLAPHDLSILLSLVDQPVELVAAIGARHGFASGPTMAYVTLRFAGGLLAHIHLNWMAPAKVRRTIIGGSQKMLAYDDIEASEKLKVFESARGAFAGPGEDIHQRMVDYRVGDVVSPRLDQSEALATEIAHVARVLLHGEEPTSDGRLGLRVVRVIEAAQRSLLSDGVPLEVEL
jgi:predicted dehydrogenase